jgi:DNA-binding beta-propeller fold protein YncE
VCTWGGTSSGGLAVLRRAPDGDLAYASCFGNPDAASGIGPVGCTPALGLGGADAVAVSHDGTSVYAAGAKSGGLAVLRRAANGDLAYAACFGNPDAATGIGPPGCTPAPGIGGASSVAVSGDGTSVYVAGTQSNGLAVLRRAPNGDLTYAGCMGNPDSATGLGPLTCDSAPGLGAAHGVAVSPDGASVYVVGLASSGLAVLRRAPDGDLTYASCFGNPDTATGLGPQGCTPALGLGGATSVAVSGDGTSVYVTGVASNALAVFRRASDGDLTYGGCFGNSDAATGIGPQGCTPVLGLGGPYKAAVSDDGTRVYVTGLGSNALAVFHRAATGDLTYAGCFGNSDAATGIGPVGCTPALGLGGAVSLAISPDSASVYVTGAQSNGLAVLRRVTTASASGGGSSTGSGSSNGSSTGSSSGSQQTTTVVAVLGNEKLTLQTSPAGGCLATSMKLKATLNSTAIAGAKAPKLRFANARFFIGRGIKHIHHHSVLRQHKKITVTSVTYTPNRSISALPASLSLPLTGLKSGTQSLKVQVAFHRQGQPVTKTLTQKFTICPKAGN